MNIVNSSDYEIFELPKSGSEYKDDGVFKYFDLKKCTKCVTGSAIMTTNDGNRTQVCLTCKTVLLKDGVEPSS